jgi:hypothetical protein
MRRREQIESMKRLLLAITCLLCSSIVSFAQTAETFDVATFHSPKGWNKEAGKNSVKFSIANKDDYCLITLYRSVPGIGNSKENFEAAWQTIVREAVSVSAAPQMAPPSTAQGWEVQTGYAPFEKSGSQGVAMLVTASGFGKMMNALILTNTQAYQAEIGAFIESITLKKLEAAALPKSASKIIPRSLANGAYLKAIRAALP